MAFYFPRFRPRSHITETSIPELKDAIDLTDPLPSEADNNKSSNIIEDRKPVKLSKRWSTTAPNITSANSNNNLLITPTERAMHLQRREKALILLERVIDIYENISGGASGENAGVVNALRPLYAMRFEMMNGNAHLPRPSYTHHIHLHKTILRQAGRLLLHNNVWDKGDVNQIDTSCVIVAHFVKVFCALWQRPFNAQTQTAIKVKNNSNSNSNNDNNNINNNNSYSTKCKNITEMKEDIDNSAQSEISAEEATLLSTPEEGNSTNDNNNNSNNNNVSKTITTTTTTTSNIDEWSLVVDEAESGSLECTSSSANNSHKHNTLTLSIVLDRINELIRLCRKVNEVHGTKYPQFRWSVSKLLLLKALITIASTGNLFMAQTLIDDAAELVFKMTVKEGPSSFITSLQGRDYEAELGLFMCAQAEIAARIFNWGNGTALEYIDSRVNQLYESASKFYAEPCNTVTDPDGIMDLSEEAIASREFELQAYSSVRASYATFLLNAPRGKGSSRHDTPVFLPQQLFTFNPLQLIRAPNHYIYGSASGHKMSLPLQRCRQLTGEALERALKLNRHVFAEHEKSNAQASWILLSMACMYGDARDYLYATGLFESALKGFVENYGPFSLEVLLLHKLRYEYLAGVGSENEAKSASHTIIALLKRMDELAVPHEYNDNNDSKQL